MNITNELVFEIANEIEATSEKPTLAKVKEAIAIKTGTKGGSFTTISEAMKAWRTQKNKKAQKLVEPIPESIRDKGDDLLSGLWQLAMETANKRMAAEREELEVLKASIEEQQQEAVEAADAMAKENERLEKALEGAHAELNMLHIQLKGSEQKVIVAETRNEEKEKRIIDIKETLHKVQEKLEAAEARERELLKRTAPSENVEETKSKKKGGKHPNKYRNPENPEQVWSGLGVKPKWLKEELTKGKKLEDFLEVNKNKI